MIDKTELQGAFDISLNFSAVPPRTTNETLAAKQASSRTRFAKLY